MASKDISHCYICDVDTPSMLSYITHQESPDHQLKKLLKSTNIPSSPVIEEIENEKAEVQQKTERENTEENLYEFCDGDVYKCRVCEIFVTGIIPFKQHLSGIKHQKKLKSRAILKSFNINDLMKNLKLTEEKLTTRSDKLDSEDVKHEIRVDVYNGSIQAEKYRDLISTGEASSLAFPYFCQPCGKRFTGEEPHQQHLMSALHLRKVQLSSNTASSLDNFTCNICCVNFSGPIPYQQHIVSPKHAKQVHANKLLGFITDETNGSRITDLPLTDEKRKEEQQREQAMWHNLALTKLVPGNRKIEEVDCIKADEPINFLKQ